MRTLTLKELMEIHNGPQLDVSRYLPQIDDPLPAGVEVVSVDLGMRTRPKHVIDPDGRPTVVVEEYEHRGFDLWKLVPQTSSTT